MKKILIYVIIALICAMVGNQMTADPQVESFVNETIDEGETVGVLIARYNGGDVGDKRTQDNVMLLNGHLKGQWTVGQQVIIPIFVH